MNLVLQKFGIIAFLIGFLGFSLALYLGQSLDYSTQEIAGWVVMGMTVALVYFGVGYQRDTVNAGRITFGQAFTTGLIIAMMGALGIAMVDVIYTMFINTNFFTDYNQYALELARESGDTITAENLEAQQKTFKEYSPAQLSLLGGLMMFVMTFVLGFVVSLLSASILKKS